MGQLRDVGESLSAFRLCNVGLLLSKSPSAD